jgi:ATP synthase subunit 6
MILGVVSLYIFLELYKNYTLDYKILKAFNVFNYKNFYFYASYLNDYLHFKNTKNNIGLVHILVTKIMSLFMFDARFTHNLITVIVSNIVNFITSIVRENFFLNRHPFFSIYYFSFISILVFNAIGLLPITVTVTSSFVFILNYSFSILVGLNLLGGYIHLTKYFNQFLPEGVPLFIAPVLALIELFSTIIRIFSLTVRLFANMLAGHSLLKIIISVSWVLITFFFFYPPIAFIV